MELDTLERLYVEELRDLLSAELQLVKALPKMAAAATDRDLRRAFKLHERQTRQQAKRLQRILREFGVSRAKHCKGMEGLVKEANELVQDDPEPEVLDAGLISKAQHVEHYEMAGYGTVRTWAEVLRRREDMQLLQETLDEEAETDQILTELARNVNVLARSTAASRKRQSAAARKRSRR